MGLIFRVRQCGSVLPWRQLATVLAGVAVIVAMVAVAETGRRDELHHQRVQVLVEQVRGSSHEIGELAWQGIAAMSSGGHADTLDATAYLSDGFQIWSQLSGEVNSLRVADHSAMTVVLLRDAGRLFTAGMAMVRNGDSLSTAQQGLRDAQTVFAALDALDRDSLAAASAQQRVASQAATREGVAYIGSLLIGLVLLVLLGLQLYRIRRRSLLVEQRQAVTRRAEERVRALVEHSSDIITVVAPDLTVRWQSSSLERALGHPVAKLVGQRLGTLVHPDDAQLLEAQLSAATGKPGTVTFTARFRDADGGWRHLEAVAENRLGDPAIEGVVLSMRDISERKALEDELRQQAFHDSLTGLANRALFEDRLAHGLAGARRHGRPVAVLFLDLDDFKTINDSLGHASGDELLRAVARRIAGVVRVTDTAARLGGDEFAVLLEVMDDEHDGEWIAKRLLEELAAPFRVAERDLRVGASIGVAVSDGSIGIDELLRNADTAMYAAKDAGKGTVKPFEEGMHKQVL
ncbi:MAG: sensor domain-containing diguanylate cyclase, partial [Solirubrobacteraceae bacterium]